MKSPTIDIWNEEGQWDRSKAVIYCDNSECRYYKQPNGDDTMGGCGCDSNQFVINPDGLIECSVMFE